MGFFSELAQTLGADLGQDLLNRTGEFINQIAPLFQAAFGVYVLMVILSYQGQGGVISFTDFVKRSVGWVVIIGLAFSPSAYSKLAGIIYQLPDEISSIFVNGAKFDVSAMDSSFDEVKVAIGKAAEAHSKYDWWNFPVHMSLVYIRAVILISGTLIIGVAFAYYMVAKISLALVLMLGAFFVGCLLFPSTRQYGINWVGQCLNHIITCTMFVLLTVVQMKVFTKAIDEIVKGNWYDSVMIEAMIPMLIVQTIVFLIVAWNIPSIASSLTGGAAVQGFARSIAAGGGAFGRAFSAAMKQNSPARRASSGGSISANTRPS
ncbi:type IV secretion system protein [Kingella oralis]|uniref:type IV secretion system protein n=1 Tax=Kingella oralis TaxID=505 RepID=UPI002D7F2208|nr:type IV secretion system protein [Kingella oralis]